MLDGRSALLRAARARFTRAGFAATSMEEIRREAGVSNGSLFHYFPTKNHLARALYVEALGRYQAALLRAIGDGVDARDGVEGMIDAHVAWVTKDKDDARVLVELREATAIDGAEVDWKSVNAEAFEALRGWVARQVDEGAMQALPFDVWMALVFAPVLQLTRKWIREGAPRVPRAVRVALAHAAWNGVAPRVTGRTSHVR